MAGKWEARLQPLTFPQRELWETSPVPVADLANHICCLIEVRGALTPKDVRRRDAAVVERQEACASPSCRARSGRADDPGEERAGEFALPRTFAVASDAGSGRGNRAGRFSASRSISCKDRSIASMCCAAAPTTTCWSSRFITPSPTAGRWACSCRICAWPTSQRTRGRPRRRLPPVPHILHRVGRRRARVLAAGGTGATRDVLEIAPRRTSRGSGASAKESGDRVGRAAAMGLALVPAELGRRGARTGPPQRRTLFSTLLAAFQITLSTLDGRGRHPRGHAGGEPHQAGGARNDGLLRGHRAAARPGRSRAAVLRQLCARCIRRPWIAFANAMPFAELVRALGDSPARRAQSDLRGALRPAKSSRPRRGDAAACRRSCGCARPAPPASTSAAKSPRKAKRLEVVWLFRPDMFSQAEVEDLDQLFLEVLASACRSPRAGSASCKLKLK